LKFGVLMPLLVIRGVLVASGSDDTVVAIDIRTVKSVQAAKERAGDLALITCATWVPTQLYPSSDDWIKVVHQYVLPPHPPPPEPFHQLSPK
jgi:hypothetical protein